MSAMTWVLAGLVITLVVAERFIPERAYLKSTIRRSYAVNVMGYMLNNVVLSLLSVTSLVWVAESLGDHGILRNMPDSVGKWIVCFVILDGVNYLWHRACHNSLLLWMFHKVHHSDVTINTSTALRFHVGELLLTLIVKSALVVALGIDAETLLELEAATTAFVFFHHVNVQIPGERWLSYLIVVPTHHRMHHSVLRSEHDNNYALVFSFWDRLFASHKAGEPQAIGLAGIAEQGLMDTVRFGFTPDPITSKKLKIGKLVKSFGYV